MLARAGTDTGEQVHVRGADAHGVIAPQCASPAPMTLEWSERDPPAPNHTGINRSVWWLSTSSAFRSQTPRST